MSQETQLLTEIKEELHNLNETLEDVKEDLRTDRSMVWKVLLITIAGAFALIGIKLALP